MAYFITAVPYFLSTEMIGKLLRNSNRLMREINKIMSMNCESELNQILCH